MREDTFDSKNDNCKIFSLILGRKFNNLLSDIDKNSITGKLPDDLSKLTELQVLLVDADD